MKKDPSTPEKSSDNKMTRKEAIQKVGKYAAFTAASMLLVMSTAQSSAAQSSPHPSGQRAPAKPKGRC